MDGHRGEDICRAARHRFIERPTPLLRCRVVSNMDVECDVVCVAARVLHRGLHDFRRQFRCEAFSVGKDRGLRPVDKVLWRGYRPRTPFKCGREDALQNELLCIRLRAPFREGGYLEGEYRLCLQLPVARVIRPPVYQRVSGRAMSASMPRSEMCLGLKQPMKTNNEQYQKCSGRERMYQAAAGQYAACRKGTFY